VIAVSDALNPDAVPLPVQKSLSISGPGSDKLTVHAYTFNAFEIYQPAVPDSDVSVAISGLAIEGVYGAIYSDNYTDPAKPFQTYLAIADVVIRCASNQIGIWVRAGTIAQVARTTISDCGDALFAE